MSNQTVAVEISELQTAARARAAADSVMERKACGLVMQYKFLLPAAAKAFFRELADHLEWHNLKGML